MDVAKVLSFADVDRKGKHGHGTTLAQVMSLEFSKEGKQLGLGLLSCVTK